MNKYDRNPIFMALDLELNQPSQKIIQVGACIGDVDTGNVLKRYNAYIKINEPIAERIIQLTKITNPLLDSEGIPLYVAYENLVELSQSYGCTRNLMTWGGDDSGWLKQQLSLEDFYFGDKYYDVKTVYQFYALSKNMKVSAGLSKALTRVGLYFKGTKHNASDDAYNTFRMAYRLISYMRGSVTCSIIPPVTGFSV